MTRLYPEKTVLRYRNIAARKGWIIRATWVGGGGVYLLYPEKKPKPWKSEWPDAIAKCVVDQTFPPRHASVVLIDPYKYWTGPYPNFCMDRVHRHLVFMFPRYEWHFYLQHEHPYWMRNGKYIPCLRPMRTDKNGTPCRLAGDRQSHMRAVFRWKMQRARRLTVGNNHESWAGSTDLSIPNADLLRRLKKASRVLRTGKGQALWGHRTRSTPLYLRLKNSSPPKSAQRLLASPSRPAS